ncbi:MAG: 50S ribosomal protein L18 [Trueperaceae bacterium]|nr:MAG: 50S ribosomal protein L18 [Trueperaceae bacterium]
MANAARERRVLRTRRRIRTPVDNGRLRLTVFRSAKHIYAQVVDDNAGRTVVEANSKSLAPKGSKVEQAHSVGKALAERAGTAGVGRVVFDRGAYRYHGRVKALAEGAREGGLDF